jgi:hypothetical protein
MWKCRRVDSPDVSVPQTERQRHSGVTLASVCTYSVSPFLFAVLKHCLSLASVFPLILILFLSLCPSFFFSVSTFLLSRSFFFLFLSPYLFLNVINVSSLLLFLYSSFSLSFLNSFSYFYFHVLLCFLRSRYTGFLRLNGRTSASCSLGHL